MQNSGERTSSVDNALRLLQLVGERKVIRGAEAAETLGTARSTAHRLLTALRRHGFVLQDKPNGVYRPGPVLNEIGLAAIGGTHTPRVARPVIEDLRERTQETISLSLLEGRDIRFIDCVESPRAVRVGSPTGVVLPAHRTAGGPTAGGGEAPSGPRCHRPGWTAAMPDTPCRSAPRPRSRSGTSSWTSWLGSGVRATRSTGRRWR